MEELTMEFIDSDGTITLKVMLIFIDYLLWDSPQSLIILTTCKGLLLFIIIMKDEDIWLRNVNSINGFFPRLHC